jgi:hypothetical protein
MSGKVLVRPPNAPMNPGICRHGVPDIAAISTIWRRRRPPPCGGEHASRLGRSSQSPPISRADLAARCYLKIPSITATTIRRLADLASAPHRLKRAADRQNGGNPRFSLPNISPCPAVWVIARSRWETWGASRRPIVRRSLLVRRRLRGAA